jgi:hypothetical protein
MKRTTWGLLVAIAVVAYLAARSIGEPPLTDASEASEQWLELSASSPIDLSDPEQRELVALVLQKLAAHGAVRSALRSQIPVPEFVGAGERSAVLLAQRQGGLWDEASGRIDLTRLMAQISGRLGGAQVRAAMDPTLPFPNPVPPALKSGRCWRVRAADAAKLSDGLAQLKAVYGAKVWMISDLPKEKSIEALALRMELETKKGDATIIFSGADVADVDVQAGRLKLQAIDCGRGGVVEVLPFLIEEFQHARFTQLVRRQWVSKAGAYALLKVDLPEGMDEPSWGKITGGLPGVSVHRTGTQGVIQRTPQTVQFDGFDFLRAPADRARWLGPDGVVRVAIEASLSPERVRGLVTPPGWNLKLSERPSAP